jgi:hypothetical protein
LRTGNNVFQRGRHYGDSNQAQQQSTNPGV